MFVCTDRSSSSYPSVFWLVGSFASGIVASHSLHSCITVSCVFLATCFKYCSRGLPHGLFSGYCSFVNVYYKLIMSNRMPCPLVASVFKFFLKERRNHYIMISKQQPKIDIHMKCEISI